MRSVCFVKRLEIDFQCGSGVLRDAMTIGDVDNDGSNELIVANASGDLAIFKGKDQWQKLTGLGMVSCVGVGDILNQGSNSLVVISGDGWCRIYNNENNELNCCLVQRIPANAKVVLLGDIDGDGKIEMVIALTDRVIRSYRWHPTATLPEHLQNPDQLGKLICLNKFESSNQIGALTLQNRSPPALLVAQPGGTFMRIQCANYDDNTSIGSENLTAPGVDYQFLGMSRMRNQNVSTEIIADLENKENNKPYAVATLDGTIMLVKDEIILWAIQVDHQIFALEKLDITGNGDEDIVACSWDGQTYMLDQFKNSVRFQLDEPVQAFCSGKCFIDADHPEGSASLVYVTFKNKIYIYHDLQISNMVSRKLNLDLPQLNLKEFKDCKNEKELRLKKRNLVEKLLYGI